MRARIIGVGLAILASFSSCAPDAPNPGSRRDGGARGDGGASIDAGEDGGESTDAGEDGGESTDAGQDGGDAGWSCHAPFETCDGHCVNTATDPNACGNCETRCSGGDVCSNGKCVASSCGVCEEGSSCDPQTSTCRANCESDGECPQPGYCGAAGRCACAGGTHLCGGRCVSDDDWRTCGTRCEPCTATDGTPICNEGACSFTCGPGAHRCGQTCASYTSPAHCGTSCSPCPEPFAGKATCDGVRCGIRCNPGYAACNGFCVLEWVGECGDSCEACTRAPPNATPACVGGCSFQCNSTWLKCGAECCHASSVGTGHAHTCFRLTTGRVRCVGSDAAGNLGDGATEWPSLRSFLPVDVVGMESGATALSVGPYHSCAVQDGTVKCWGSNQYGEVGVSGPSAVHAPAVVPGVTSAIAVSAGLEYTCAVTQAGALYCWGRGSLGRLGTGDTNGGATPRLVYSSGVTAVSAGEANTCAIRSGGGALYCWGRGVNGVVGDGSATGSAAPPDRLSPVAVYGLGSGVSDVAVGRSHACAVVNGGVKCWGSNLNRQLGGTPVGKSWTDRPIDVPGLSSGVVQIAAGDSHTCARLSTGAVRCWGFNDFTQVSSRASREDAGVGCGASCLTSNENTPPGFENGGAIWISGGSSSTCAVTTEGGIKCWGWNNRGKLGTGDEYSRPGPFEMVGR